MCTALLPSAAFVNLFDIKKRPIAKVLKPQEPAEHVRLRASHTQLGVLPMYTCPALLSASSGKPWPVAA